MTLMRGFSLRFTAVAIAAGLLSAGCATTVPPSTRTSRATAPAKKKGPVLCVATRESTRQQREIAEASARRVYFSKRSKRRAALRKQKSRLIAVLTVKNTESTGEATCMVFDVQTEKLVGSLVFDCDRVPKIGETIKFAAFNATYVGG